MKQRILYMIIGLSAVLMAMAQKQFRTSEYGRLANALQIDTRSLPEGYSHPITQGLTLSVHKDKQTVDHIGLYLFSNQVRISAQSPVFDFLERYFLQLKYPPTVKSTANMIRDDKFRFIKGTIATIDDIRLTDSFSFSHNNRYYTATWQRDGQDLLSVSFPVEYELISGENKIEAEENLLVDIQNTTVKQRRDETRRNDSYINDSFSNRLYYQHGQLISDSKHPAETLANLMLSTNTMGNYNIHVSQISYGFQKKVFEVPLRQWIAFCQNNGCKLYFGVENISEKGEISAVVLAVNEAENYNHVLTVSIPTKTIDAHQGVIDVQLFPYVPTHNVLNMFANYRKSNPKIIVKR